MNQEEHIYKTMKHAGAAGVVLGVITLVTGLVTGILMVVSGAKLLARKSDVFM